MRHAIFPLVMLDTETVDRRTISSVAISGLPLPVLRSMDDPLRDVEVAGEIEIIAITGSRVSGFGWLADDLAMPIFNGEVQLAAEADTVPSEPGKLRDMRVTLTGATIGTRPCWDDFHIALGIGYAVREMGDR